jgi:CRISPR/Cas system-associated exonuclease Cas4 (RecB family)
VTSIPSEESRSWVSVSDLAEYAYCPRAYWYRHHPPEAPADRSAERSSRRGETYHRRALSGVRRTEEHGVAIGLAAIAVAILLLVLLVFVVGFG